MGLGADDLVAIRRTADLYAVAVDRGDAALFADQFMPGGVLVAPRGRFVGREALAGVPTMMKERYERTFHAVLTQVVDGTGDQASGETYCIARHWFADGAGKRTCLEMTIRYQDRFERCAGRWLIAGRELVVDATHRYSVDRPGQARGGTMADEISILGLAGKVALVTGGGAGIGRATAELFRTAGMSVAIAEIDAARADDVRAALGADHLVVQADVRSAGDVARLLEAVDARFGRLDVLVNNVGDYLGYKKPFEESTATEWDELYAVNLLHMFHVTKAAIPLIRRGGKGGAIINLSTIEAFRGIPHTVVYAAFKAAITGFTQSLAVELGADDIRVNAVAPETTNSAQIVATPRVPPENRDYLKRWFPIGRFGEGEDSAGAALFLASERLSGWVTGSTIVVDGGALAAGAWMRLPDGRNFTHLPIIVADGYTPRPQARDGRE